MPPQALTRLHISAVGVCKQLDLVLIHVNVKKKSNNTQIRSCVKNKTHLNAITVIERYMHEHNLIFTSKL